MNLVDVQSVAENLINEWLSKYKWKLEFISQKKMLGRCQYVPKTIQINKFWCAVLTEEEILDTIKHEIAHAYCFEHGNDDNHGNNWKVAAVKIGAKPYACYAGSIKPPVRYKAKCDCGAEYKTGDLKTKYNFCSFCKSKLVYVDQYARILKTN